MSLTVTQDFVPVPNDERFVAYAAGFARILFIKLHDKNGITADELGWLRVTSDLMDPDAACRKLIDAYALQQVTARITS